MKKKIITIIIGTLILIMGITSFIIYNNRTISTIFLDINPSIEIRLKKGNIVKKVIALNDDAKSVISIDLLEKKLDDSFGILVDNLTKEGYIVDKQVTILLYVDGNSNTIDSIENVFQEKEIHTDMIVIDKVTKEDKKLAKKYNVSIAKASYINTIAKDNKNIESKDLVNKEVMELKETKETGKYCDSNYRLEGDFCVKEIRREKAADGMVCPAGYYDYEGKCYEEVAGENSKNLICRDEFTLNGNECTRKIIIGAEPVKYYCETGEEKTRAELGLTGSDAGDANYIVCVDYSNATHPVTPCELPANDPTERMSYGGRCYWHRAPVIASGCPGKIQVNGMCWDDATNIYICAGYRDGKQYKSKSEYCEHSIKYIEPKVLEYKCMEDGFILNGSKCEKVEKEDAMHEKICPSGYSIINYDRCINYNKIANKENGYVCNMENSRVEGNTCIINDIIPAKH